MQLHSPFKYLLCLIPLLCAACGETVQPEKVDGTADKVYESNAFDAVGVADGNKQVSPFGKPAH